MAAAGACFRARLAREPSTAGDRTARGLAGYRRTWPPSFDGRGRGVLPGTHRLGAPSAAAEGRRERSGRRTWPPSSLPAIARIRPRAGGRVQPSRPRARPARRPNRAGAGKSSGVIRSNAARGGDHEPGNPVARGSPVRETRRAPRQVASAPRPPSTSREISPSSAPVACSASSTSIGHSPQRHLKLFRLEAVRAGFRQAWQAKDYATILAVACKIPDDVLHEDPKLLMWYDQAQTRQRRG